MKHNIGIYYLITFIVSSLSASYLYYLAEDSSWSLFYPTLVFLGIVLGGLFLSAKEYEEKELITNKYHLGISVIVGLAAIIVLLTVSFKGFIVWEWNAEFGNGNAHIHGRRAGLIYFILNVTKAIEPLWWGVIFGIYGLCLIPGIAKSMLSFFQVIQNQETIKKNESFKSDVSFKEKSTEENINKLIYSFIKSQIDKGETKTLIPYFEKTSVELDENCVIENYYFNSEKQSEDVLNEYNGDISKKAFIESELLSVQSLQKLGDSFRKYFYENMENNDSLQKSLSKGLKMRYIVRTKALSETNPIIITDVTISSKDVIN